MATPTFVVNGSITCYGVTAEWQRQARRRNGDGSITWQEMASHTWDIPQMEMSTFLSLQALAGSTLSSLATTAITDRNNGATYTTAEIVSVVNASQVGRRAVGVRVEFRVSA